MGLLSAHNIKRGVFPIDSSMPLVPGVNWGTKEKSFWQNFVYENLSEVCFICGRMGQFSTHLWNN